jgi:hypothetical protein
MTSDLLNRIPDRLSELPSEVSDDPFERAARRVRRAALRGRDAPEQHTDPATLASIAASALPFSGVIEAAGFMPDFRGGAEPSLLENWREGNRLASALQVVGAVGGPLGVVAKAVRKVPVGKWAKYAEKYPEVGPPALHDKVTGKRIAFDSQEEAEALVSQGKAYWRKNLSPEVKQFARDRRAIQRDMDVNGFTPYFDPAKRADVDSRNYPTSLNMTIDAMPARLETINKYKEAYQTEDAKKRLVAGYVEGQKIPDAKDWFFVKQLEDEYIRVLGPEVGRERFKKEFADSMAAATAGNTPTANFLMAHYANVMNKAGLRLPKNSYELPHPIGGGYGSQNLAQLQKLFDDPLTEFGAKNPKRHDFSYSFVGHKDKPPVDSVITDAIVSGTRAPRYYGPASELLKYLADIYQVNARHFQDLARAGLQKLKHDAKHAQGPGDTKVPFKFEGPAINVINESIERTQRLTGMPREEIVERGLVRKEIPMYGVGGAMLVPMIGYGSLDSTSDNSWRTREGSL